MIVSTLQDMLSLMSLLFCSSLVLRPTPPHHLYLLTLFHWFPFPTTHTNSETISSSPSPAITSFSCTSLTPADVVPSLLVQSAASFLSSSRLERSSHDTNASVVHIDETSQPPTSNPPMSSDLVVPPIQPPSHPMQTWTSLYATESYSGALFPF